MLKKCTLIAVFLLLTSSVFAYEQGAMLLSPRIGFGINNTKIDDYDFPGVDRKLSMAWNIGLDFNYFFMDNLSFLTGLLYESENISYKGSMPGIPEIGFPATTVEADMDFSFITIPIGIRYFFSEYFLVGGGLYFGLSFNPTATVKIPGWGVNQSGDLEGVKNDFGLFVDLGGIYKLSEQGALSAYIRFKQGLKEIGGDTKTQTITLNFAYSFKF